MSRPKYNLKSIQQIELVRHFAHDVKASLEGHLMLGSVSFRGSFADNSFDEYSDVDLEAQVHGALDNQFYSDLERFLSDRYGPALVRYDPDCRENRTIQNVRFSFYNLPVFWRVDLTVTSNLDSGTKSPTPFPDWHEGTSALMNVLWAIKYHNRGDNEAANHYLECSCHKGDLSRLTFSTDNALVVLEGLRRRKDIDPTLAAMVIDALPE